MNKYDVLLTVTVTITAEDAVEAESIAEKLANDIEAGADVNPAAVSPLSFANVDDIILRPSSR